MISRTVKWVTGVHGAILLALLISSLLKSCSLRKKKPEPLTIEIAMVSASAVAGTPQIQEVAQMPLENVSPPAPTAADPAPLPEPTKTTTPAKKTPPEPTPKKWEPKKVVRQDTKVRNPNAQPKPTTASGKSLDQISRELAQSIASVAVSSANNSIPAAYGQIIQSKMYAAWRQPSVASHQTRGAVIRIRIEKNGIISIATLEQSSGNGQIDRTALQAARSVRLPDLPANIQQNFIEMTIEFKLTN